MHSSVFTRGAAIVAAVAVVGLSAGPASAATVAQASSTAVSLDVGRSVNVDSKQYSATYDGSSSSTSGNHNPVISALNGQQVISNGALIQDAVAGVKDGKSYSAACSGLVGDGAGYAGIGKDSCLTSGGNVSLTLGNLQLDKLQINDDTLYKGWDSKLRTTIAPVQRQLTSAVVAAVTKTTDAVGTPALHLDLSGATSSCSVSGADASGASQIADASAYTNLPFKGKVPLVSLPAHPAANQKIVTNLSGVRDAILAQVQTNLHSTVDKALAPVIAINSPLISKIVDQVVVTVEAILDPLLDNILSITLNKQDTTDRGISVTALDISVLPAAQQLLKTDVAHIAIGSSECGPNKKGALKAPVVDTPGVDVAAPQTGTNALPDKASVSVHAKGAPANADVSLMSSPQAKAGLGALIALVVLAAAGAGTRFYLIRARRS